MLLEESYLQIFKITNFNTTASSFQSNIRSSAKQLPGAFLTLLKLRNWLQMKHTGKDIWEAILIVITGYKEYISQLSLELNEAKDLKQTCSEGDRISKEQKGCNEFKACNTGHLRSFALWNETRYAQYFNFTFISICSSRSRASKYYSLNNYMNTFGLQTISTDDWKNTLWKGGDLMYPW